MQNKFIIIFLSLTFFWESCSFNNFPSYLPPSDKIDVNARGSFIKIEFRNGNKVEGELISADSTGMAVLIENERNDYLFKKIFILKFSSIEEFNLYYAKPENYYPKMYYSFISLLHGIWLFITMPLNLGVTYSIAYGSENSFKHNSSNMKINDLKKFSRFPQGMPENIKLEDIKN